MQKHEQHALIIKKLLEISQISVPKESKAELKSMKLCPWAILGRKSRSGRPQDAKGSSVDLAFGSLLAEYGAPRVTCWGPLGTKIGSKNVFLRIAWQF